MGDIPTYSRTEADETPVEKRWEEIKKAEKADYSPVSHVPKILPALLRAYVISQRAAKVGFDWEKLEDIHEKMAEEIGELKAAEARAVREEIEEEIGDLLFTVVNISRRHAIDPENALRLAIDKFLRRFGHIERNLDATKGDLESYGRPLERDKGKGEKGGIIPLLFYLHDI